MTWFPSGKTTQGDNGYHLDVEESGGMGGEGMGRVGMPCAWGEPIIKSTSKL